MPSDVLLFEIVGPEEVFQQIPRAVTDAPPSADIVPPEVAELVVIEVAFEVVSAGSVGGSAGGGHAVKTIDNTANKYKGLIKRPILAFIFSIC